MASSNAAENKVDAMLARLAEIVQEVDMEITTQRQVTNKLAEEFGEDVYEYKALIKEKTNKLLGLEAEKPSQEQDTEEPAGSKRKRKDDNDMNDTPKNLRPSETNGEFAIELSHTRQARVSSFKGQLYVNIREWYEKDGSLAPGKGISLQVPLWNELTANLDAIATAISDEDTDFTCKLTRNRQVSVKQFKGKLQWNRLVFAVPDINAAVKEQRGDTGQAQAASVKTDQAKAGQDSVKDAATAGAGPSTAAADEPNDKSAATESSGASDLPVQLSAMRKADVSPFKGILYVSIREYYEKDGQQMPGKKGINLPADQFQKLLEAQASVTAALEAQDASFDIALSGKRKASISVFKGKPMVNIREFYEQDGEQKPGSKGISLPPEQWHKLVAGFGQLDAALKAHAS
ncbi:MAG: transcriptional coactivator p15 [Trebouxia sp. A1-2]|nr:MAG: transcriptional coactivator p15 [Trebouxia sp. A1-2]